MDDDQIRDAFTSGFNPYTADPEPVTLVPDTLPDWLTEQYGTDQQ
jgi:hypothetical protein